MSDFLKSTTATDARGNVVPVGDVTRSGRGGFFYADLNGLHYCENGTEYMSGALWRFNKDGVAFGDVGIRLNPPEPAAVLDSLNGVFDRQRQSELLTTLRQLRETHPELNIRFDEPPPPMDPIKRAYREYMALICDAYDDTRQASRWRNGEEQIDD